ILCERPRRVELVRALVQRAYEKKTRPLLPNDDHCAKHRKGRRYSVSAPMNVRRIAKADFDRIVEVIDHWWGGPISTFAHPIFFYELGGAALVVEEGSLMIGFLLGFVVAGTGAAPPARSQAGGRCGYVHLVGIHPDFRRRGVGR